MRCPNPDCPFLKKRGQPAEYRAGIAACSDCGAALTDAPVATLSSSAMPLSFQGEPALPWPRAVRVALAVTAGALFGVFAFQQVPLPWVDAELARFAFGYADAQPSSRFGVAALGLGPWMTGILLTEIAAAIVPRWRPLRHGGFDGRARLARVSIVVGMLVASVMAWALTQQFAALDAARYDSVAPDLYGLGPRLALALTLVTGACVVRLVASLIDRLGVGNGLVLLVAATSVPALSSHLVRVAYGITPIAVVVVLACFALPAVLAWRFVRPLPTDADDPADPNELACRPDAGAVPAMWAITVPALLASFITVHTLQRPLTQAVVAFAVAAALVPLCARVFGSGAPSASARKASWFLNLGVVAAWSVPAAIGTPVVDVTMGLVLFVVVRDIVEEVQFRRLHPNAVSVWPMHSFAHAAPAVQALRNEGIAVHARASHYRALTHFFGPWAPIDLLVDDDDAARARSIVRSVMERSLAQT